MQSNCYRDPVTNRRAFTAPVSVTLDASPGSDCQDMKDRVRGFFSYHPRGANFVFSDSSVRFITEETSPSVYRSLSTIAGSE